MWKCRFVKGFYLLLQYLVLYQAEEERKISTRQLVGCFRENTLCEDHCSSLPDYSTVMDKNYELFECATTCRTKDCSFFGREGDTARCHCGKKSPKLYGQLPLMHCNRSCSDETVFSTEDALRCGGIGVIAVYRTCDTGLFGINCTENCGCPDQGACALNGICFGTRLCDRGWSQQHCSVRDCSVVNGDCLTLCQNTPDAANINCSCLNGYKEVGGVSCEDVDECASAGQNCSTCLNNNGSSTCTCIPGFTVGWLNGTNENGTISDTPICIDFDECASGSICGTFNCSNTYGSYRCICPEGYTAQGNVTSCQDIDECSLSTVYCQHCRNSPGSYTCDCDTGYTLRNSRCEDVDECATGQHNCTTQLQCSNNNGSFTCLTTTTALTTRPITSPIITQPITSPIITQPITSPISTRPITSPIITRPITSPIITQPITGCRIDSVLLTGGSQTRETSYAYRQPVSVQFKATVQSNCQITQPLQYMWKITPASTTSGAGQPSAGNTTSGLQETLPVDYFTCQTSSLTFGQYIAEVTVMQPSATTSRFNEVVNKTYFQVVKTELFAILQGGSAVTMDIKKTVKLDASLSVDPEAATTGISNLRYKWYCVKGKKILPMVAGRLAEPDSQCHGDWTAPTANLHNTSGLPTPYTTLAECQEFCVHDSYCSGIYVDPSSVARTYCFVKIANSPLTALNSATYYELRSRIQCDHTIKISAGSSTSCLGNWSQPKYGMHFAGGILTHDQNSVECQRHCVLEALCIGIDMRYIPGSPFCWLMIQPGTAAPLVGSIHLDLLGRTGCADTTGTTASDCIVNEHVLLNKSSKVIEFPASAFLNSYVQPDYTFTVVIGKPFFLSQSVSQTVTLIDARQTNDININCEVNCDFVMNPSFALVLRASCLWCLDQTYQWSISTGSKGPLRILTAQDTDGGLNSAVLSVKPNVFKSAAHDLYTINLVVTYGSKVARGSNYTFETTGSPIVERCLIAPNVGRAMVSDFAISCIGAVGNVPLTYTFTLHGCTGGGGSSILYNGLQPGVQKLRLPSGDAGHLYMVCVSATISDSFAVKTTVELKATVSGDNFTLADLQEMTRNASRLKAQGDIAGSTALLDLIAFTTNDLTAKNLLKDSVDDKKQFRLSLVNAISNLSGVAGGSASPDSTILKQSVTALRKATSNPDEIDPAGIAGAIDLRKLSTNIGDGGKSLQPEVRSSYYQDSYRQLLEVGSNLISSSRNAAQETKKVKNVVDTVLDVLDSAGKKLSESTFLERKTSIQTDSFTASVSAIEPSPTRHTTVTHDKFAVSLPPELFSGVPTNEANEFKISVVTFKENPFWWANSSDEITSGCARVVVSRNRVEHTAPKSMSSTIKMSLPMKSSTSRVKDTMGSIYPDNVAFFEIDIQPPGGSGAVLKMTIDADPTQLDGTATFRFCRGKREDIGARLAIDSYCHCQTVWTVKLSSSTKLPQSMIAKLEVDMLSELGNFLIVEYANSHNVAIDVTLKTSQIHCRVWDKESTKWDQSGCLPDVDASSTDLLVCKCNHLSSFAGSFLVKPNSINIAKSLRGFLVPWENPVGLILVCIVWVLFVLAMLWARRKDKFDIVMALPIDLEDNGINARYVYLVTVFTGSRYGSGTSSDVYVCLIGVRRTEGTLHFFGLEDIVPDTSYTYEKQCSVIHFLEGEVGTSAPHRLWCSEYKVLQQGHVNIFILRTVASLGKLRAIRFWHYNSGKHPQWFLSRAIVYDQQSLVASHFLCQSWLALNMENGVVDRTFLVATPEEVEGFQHLFLINTLRGLNDKHIWISVVGRPSLSTFSRMQRVACCLLLILGYLVTNMMFFQVQISEEQKHMKLLVFTFDWGMFAIAIESAVIMFPVTLLTVSIFRNARPPPQEYKLLRQWEKAVDANFSKIKASSRTSSSTASEPESSSISSKPSTTGRYQREAKQTSGMYTPKSTDSSKPETASTSSNLLKGIKTSDESSGSNVSKHKSHNLNRNRNFESPESSDSETESVLSENSSKYQLEAKQSGGMYTPKSTDSSKPETTSTISNLLRGIKTSDESSGSNVSKHKSHNRNHNFQSPESSDPETASVYSENSSKYQRDAKLAGGMYTPKSTDSSKPETSSTISNLLRGIKTSDESSGSNVSKHKSHNRNHNFQSPESSDPETASVYSENSSKYQRDAKLAGGMYTPKSTDSSKPETSSTISNLLRGIKTSDESSGSNVSKHKSHNLNRNRNFETPESSDPETEHVYSEHPSKHEKFYRKGDELYSPESTPSSSDLTLGEGRSAASRSGEHLTDDAEFHSVIEGDGGSEKGFPWWTVYIALALVICASVSFSAVIILYSFEFGLQRSIDWLKVVILSFFTGILIQEPLKIIATAIVIAVIFKRSEDIQLTNSDSVTEDSVRGLQSADKRHLNHFNQLRMHPHYRPPTRRSVITARDMITRQLAMYRIVWEIARYIFFILLALVITNIRRDYNVFLLNDSYKRGLFDQKSYRQIADREAFWNWVTTSWLNFTYADDQTTNSDNGSDILAFNQTTNSDNESDILGLMGSGTSVLMRSPRLVRFPKGTNNPLRYLYSNETGADDTVSLGMTRREAKTAITSAVQKNWVHRNIGGTILEAVSYTASADLLSVLLVILELPSSGGINVHNYFHTLKFHQYQQTFQLVSFGLEILYFVFTLWFMVYVIKQMFQLGGRKYFGSIWNWLDFLVVLLSMSLIVVYALLNVLLFVTVETYEETRELEFTYVAMLDILLSALLGFVCVLGILKCLQLLRFSPLINGLITVLSKASSYILAFLFYSFCLFVVFVLLLHLLFYTIVGDFRSVGSSLMTLVLAVAKQYNYNQVYKYDSLWGPMLVLTCVLVFHIVVLNVTFAIIAAALRELKTLSQVTKDAEFLGLLFNRVFGWLDFAGRKERDKANQLRAAALEPSEETVSRSNL